MHIEKALSAPNGATMQVHRIFNINIHTVTDPDGVSRVEASATVNSYADATNRLIGWQSIIPLDITALSSDPMLSVAGHLTSADQFLEGGVVVP